MQENEKEKQVNNGIDEEPEVRPLDDGELRLVRASVAEDRKNRRRLTYYDNSDKAKLIRMGKRHKYVSAMLITLAVTVAIVIAALGVWGVAAVVNEIKSKSDYTYIIGDQTYTEKYKIMNRDGVVYVDMYKIADYTGMIRTGKVNDVKFTTDVGHYLRFEDGSSLAVINGSLVELGGTAVVNAQVCEIPFEFLAKAIGKNNGLKLTLNTTTNTVRVRRLMYEPDENKVIKPVEILFSPDAFSIIDAIIRPAEDVIYEYTIDVSPFLDSIDPPEIGKYLVLANKENPLGKDYQAPDLTELSRVETANNRKMYLCADAETALYLMMLDMRACGISDCYVTSAYRSYSYQVDLFEGYVKGHMENEGMTREEAEAAALEYSARPGTSEHQTGLCIDFMTSTMTELDESFEDTDAFRWLSENAYKYGFILRYPEDKVDTTGYKYEPWHYRFVGRTVAAEIHASDMCLEEYLKLN